MQQVTFTINILYIVVVLLFGNILIGGTTMSIVKILSFTATCSTAIIALTGNIAVTFHVHSE